MRNKCRTNFLFTPDFDKDYVKVYGRSEKAINSLQLSGFIYCIKIRPGNDALVFVGVGRRISTPRRVPKNGFILGWDADVCRTRQRDSFRIKRK